jgi:hypothetical protein
MNEPSAIHCGSQGGSTFSNDEMLTDYFDEDGNPRAPDLNLDDLISDTVPFQAQSDIHFPIDQMLKECIAAIERGDYNYCPAAYGRSKPKEPDVVSRPNESLPPGLLPETFKSAFSPSDLIEPGFPSMQIFRQ